MRLLEEIKYDLISISSEALEYEKALANLYCNGDVSSWAFEPSDSLQYKSALENSRESARSYELRCFLEWLSTSHAVAGLGYQSFPEFRELGGFSCEGKLTELLCFGGSYLRERDIDRARSLSCRCMVSLFGQELHKLRAYVTHEPWAPWFRNSGWDVSVFVNDYASGRWWLLCATDTD